MIKYAAAEVDRPLVYAVAVIVVGFLPIYVLTGPSGLLFKPMADTMIFAIIGSLIVTLTLLPVLCAWFMRRGIREKRNKAFDWIKERYIKGLDYSLANPWRIVGASTIGLIRFAADPRSLSRRGIHAQLDWGRAVGARHHAYTISYDESARKWRAQGSATC